MITNKTIGATINVPNVPKKAPMKANRVKRLTKTIPIGPNPTKASTAMLSANKMMEKINSSGQI